MNWFIYDRDLCHEGVNAERGDYLIIFDDDKLMIDDEFFLWNS